MITPATVTPKSDTLHLFVLMSNIFLKHQVHLEQLL